MFHNIRIDISPRIQNTFEIQPLRWKVERTFSWFQGSRRLSKNYEIKAVHAETMCIISHINTLLRRFWFYVDGFLTKLSNILSKASRGRFGKQDAQSLKSLAMSSVGVKNTYISIQITQTIAQIELIESQLTELETVIEAAVDELDSVIMTVPGIGKLNGAMILGEIGDIKRFRILQSFLLMQVLTRS